MVGMDDGTMIESPKIFRLAIHDEPFTPRLVFSDQPQIVRGSLRFASCYELAAPLRRNILKVRQTILDCQQENGFFTCPQGTTPRSIAEFLLCAYWLGLQVDPSLELIFTECVARLIESQDPSGRWPAEYSDVDPLTTTLLAYLALKLFAVSVAGETMVSARRFLMKSGGFKHLGGLAQGYLALFGEIPFEKLSAVSENEFSPNEEYYWKMLMQQHVHRQLCPSEALVELYVPCTTQTESWTLLCIQQKLNETFRKYWRKLKSKTLFKRVLESPPGDAISLNRYREIFYSAMANEGPAGELDHSPDLQKLLERLKNHTEGVDAVLMADVSLQAACLESLLLSGLPVDSVAVAKAAKTLGQASLPEQSHTAQTSGLRAACLVQQADCSDDSLPPPIQLLSRKDVQQVLFEKIPWAEQLVASIPERVCALLATQKRTGSWDHCPVATAEALSALSLAGLDLSHKRMAAALRFLRQSQRVDGSWHSDKAVNRIAATSIVIAAARSTGLASIDPLIVRGASWLIANQQPGGSWSDKTFESIDPLADEGFVSLSNTAVVLGALMDCKYGDNPSVALGIDFLLEADLLLAESDIAADSPMSLAELCPILRALCRWTAVENNRDKKKVPTSGSLELLSILD